MSNPVIQTSFHAGEWAPALNARVDLAKYHSAAALLRNFYVDYRGGASSRPGTKYVATAVDSTNPVRLIPFQASPTVGYILEFGNLYMRPIFAGAPVAFTLNTPYIAADLALLKFTQNVDKLYICHPNYPPSILQLITATNWTLTPIQFGSTIGVPTGLGAATTNAGTGHYGYTVTAVDINGQESTPPTPIYSTINTTAGQIAAINLSWTAVTGAQSYNIYRTPEAISADPPAGSSFGFLMNVTGTAAADTFTSNSPTNAVDFSVTPPIPKNPFQGAGVDHVTVTGPGLYTAGPVPSVTFSAAPSGGVTATGQAVLGATSIGIVVSTIGISVGQIAVAVAGGTTAIVTSVDGSGHVLTANILAPGSVTSGNPPANPMHFVVSPITSFDANLTWGVTAVNVLSPGAGYTSTPTVIFSAGLATATAVLQSSTAGNPAVPGFHQQRLVFAAKPLAVQTFDMSETGSYYNFNVSSPVQATDAIEGSLVAGQLNSIRSMVSVPTGLVMFTNRANWLISAGGGGAAVTPIDIVANAHSYIGASDVPPIISNFDILFVQSKGSIVRDLAFNFYTQIYTGTDISVLSSHLFYGHTILEWAWAEEPFKIVWAVRDDGVALTLTFLKEQELIGWAHSDTQGSFTSVATVTEQTSTAGQVDAIYFVVQRTINGQSVKYIERLAERIFPNGAQDAWCVDAGIQYNGPPATSFSGATHLAGATVTGLADGVPITPFVMPLSGAFTLPNTASKVTVGLPFLPQLQTLPLDVGEPTVQGKRKQITAATIRVQETLGLSIGRTFSFLTPMKDLVIGNVGSATNSVVNGLVTADARTIIDASWTVPGQYCIQQPYPLPATVLGVIPEIQVGDTK